MLAQEEVAGYLLDRGLLDPAAVLDGDVVVRDVSSRNRNFSVEASNSPCFFLKQGLTPDATSTIAHEAAVYQRLTRNGALAKHLPAFFGYGAGDGVLVLELVREAADLRSLHVRTGGFSFAPAALVGAALGALHRNGHASEFALAMQPAFPWVLWVDRPGTRLFRDVSAAGLELIRMVHAAPGFPQSLERLRAKWRSETLVHGDVKWDNCLVHTAEGGAEELRLIDWESAGLGDPCWDIGSALSHYLSFWLFSIPVTGAVAPERLPELASYPLDSMKPALSACWTAYVDERALGTREASEDLLHAVEMAGARLVQTAFEAAQMMQQLTSSLVLHLQLALNILQRPEQAATQLLGLPLYSSSAA